MVRTDRKMARAAEPDMLGGLLVGLVGLVGRAGLSAADALG